MSRFDQERATARSDNRRMTGNVNIYICSEAYEKGKRIVETDSESAVSKVSETTKINLNPSNVVSTKLNRNRNERSNGNNNATNNREKLIMTTEFNERQSHEVKSRSNDTKLLMRTAITSNGNSDEKHKLSGIVSCRCPQYDESDLWLRNLKNKRERKAVVEGKHEEKKVIEELRSSSKEKNLLVVKHDQKLGSTKHESKVSKPEKKKKKVKETKNSNKNTSWFSYFRRKPDADAKEDIILADEDLCTCKWKSNLSKNKNKKDEEKKRKKDKDDKKLISSKKSRKDYPMKSESKIAEVKPKDKIPNDVNDGIRKTEKSDKTNNLDGKIKEKEKHGHKKKPLIEEKINNKELAPKENNQEQKLPKSPENQKNIVDRKPALKKNNENKSTENKASIKEISFDTNKKKASLVQKVKVKKKTNTQEDPTTARKSKSNTDDTRDLKNTKTEDQNSFFIKFFNLFKSKRDVPQRNTNKKKRSRCDESCSELKRTAKTSSSVQRKNRSKRKKHKSELAGKINGQKFTEKAIISSNKSNIQVNERKFVSRHVNTLNNTEETNKKLSKPNDIMNSHVLNEATKGNIKKTNSEEFKTNKSLQTDYSQNSLRICFSCLFPSGNCLCKRKFPDQQSCDCRKVTFCCDENCKPSNDKIPYGSAILPYQKLKNYPKVVNEMQGKMNESKHTCCNENNHNDNERCTCTCEECDDDCTSDKKPRAKCYYCKNLPCRCGCVIRTPGYSSKQ